MPHSHPEISERLAEVYSNCHEAFQRLMADAREPNTDDEVFAAECRDLCERLIELQQTWSQAYREANGTEF